MPDLTEKQKTQRRMIVLFFTTFIITLISALACGLVSMKSGETYDSLNCEALNQHLTSKIIATDCFGYVSNNTQKHIFLKITDCDGPKYLDTLFQNLTDSYEGVKTCWYYSGEIWCPDFKSNLLFKEGVTIRFVKPPEIQKNDDYQACLTQANIYSYRESGLLGLASAMGGFSALMLVLMLALMAAYYTNFGSKK